MYLLIRKILPAESRDALHRELYLLRGQAGRYQLRAFLFLQPRYPCLVADAKVP